MQKDPTYNGWAANKPDICDGGGHDTSSWSFDYDAPGKGCNCNGCACGGSVPAVPSVPTPEPGCDAVPPECSQFSGNLIWAALFGLLPRDYLHPNSNVGEDKGAALTRLRVTFGKTYIDDVSIEMDRRVLKKLLDSDEGGAKLVAYSPDGDAKLDRFKSTVFYDGLHALVAFVIIFTIMSMHAGSSFVAACAFFQMTMAFGCAFTIYQGP